MESELENLVQEYNSILEANNWKENESSRAVAEKWKKLNLELKGVRGATCMECNRIATIGCNFH